MCREELEELRKELDYLYLLRLKYPSIFNDNYDTVCEELTQIYFENKNNF